jgi:hypothetical protein
MVMNKQVQNQDSENRPLITIYNSFLEYMAFKKKISVHNKYQINNCFGKFHFLKVYGLPH